MIIKSMLTYSLIVTAYPVIKYINIENTQKYLTICIGTFIISFIVLYLIWNYI